MYIYIKAKMNYIKRELVYVQLEVVPSGDRVFQNEKLANRF